MPRLHPNLAEIYRQKVLNLAEALNDKDSRHEAAECIRELIEKSISCRRMGISEWNSTAS